MKTQTRKSNAKKSAGAREAGKKPATETGETRTVRPVDVYVLAKGEWVHRKTVNVESSGDDTKDANRALREYGVSGTRPRQGEANSKSGKRFKAVPTLVD